MSLARISSDSRFPVSSRERRIFGRGGPGLADCLRAFGGPQRVTARELRPLVDHIRPDAPDRAARALTEAAAAMLAGRLAEIENARDRSDAILLAAAARALAGEKVHVIAHCELRARQLHDLSRVGYARLGVSSAYLGDTADLDSRTAGYARAVVFASLSRLAQDRLRDKVEIAARTASAGSSVRRLSYRDALLPPLMPARVAALVDDADLVLIERPRPVRFASEHAFSLGRVYADQAFAILSSLLREQHYSIDPITSRIRLSRTGELRVETFAVLFGGAWNDAGWRNETVLAALTVRDLFRSPTDYRIENGAIVLLRGTAQGGIEPTIPDLIAAKEGLPGGIGVAHMADTRRTLAAYDSLGGAGVGLHAYRQELLKGNGLRVQGPETPLPPPSAKVFATRSALLDALGGLLVAPDALIWTPNRDDAEGLPPSLSGREVVTGDAVFFQTPEPKVIVQIGAAPPGWELRLQSCLPHARLIAFVSAQDGLFGLLEPTDSALAQMALHPQAQNYQGAQQAVAGALRAQRLSAIHAQSYFDRILSFLGDTP